jgi:predicted nucleic acid-binding protein
MRVLVDTNIFLDVLMEREPWLDKSLDVINWCGAHPGDAWIAWHSLSNLWYVGAKLVGKKSAGQQIDAILDCFDVAPAHSNAARRARQLNMLDFEDALQAAAAMECGAKQIITRNTADYKRSPVAAISPTSFLSGS